MFLYYLFRKYLDKDICEVGMHEDGAAAVVLDEVIESLSCYFEGNFALPVVHLSPDMAVLLEGEVFLCGEGNRIVSVF